MFQFLNITAKPATFIGAGLSMVAYGASASVGLAEAPEATNDKPSQPTDAGSLDTPHDDLRSGLANRLEAYSFRGC